MICPLIAFSPSIINTIKNEWLEYPKEKHRNLAQLYQATENAQPIKDITIAGKGWQVFTFVESEGFLDYLEKELPANSYRIIGCWEYDTGLPFGEYLEAPTIEGQKGKRAGISKYPLLSKEIKELEPDRFEPSLEPSLEPKPKLGITANILPMIHKIYGQADRLE